MGILTDDDIKLIQEAAQSVEYGSIELEFKNGKCLSITEKGRKLTVSGKKLLDERKKHQ